MVRKSGDVMNRVVLKLSGSVFSENATKSSLLKYATMLKSISKKVQLVVVAGGGHIARHYISLARSFGVDEASLDELGIEVSRLNAQLLVYALGRLAHPHIPRNLQEVVAAVDTGKIVVTGGLHPGQSTNATAAQIAEKINARMFINATDVEGIYDTDPKTHKNAKLLKTIKLTALRNMLVHESTMAGAYDLMDIVALKVIERSRIPTRVVKADVNKIKRAVSGADLGTKIIT
jgi:uridylate kinase